MKTMMMRIAILLAFGCLTFTASADQSFQITLSSASKIAGSQFQAGEYRVLVDAPKIVLTETRSGKSVELEAKVETMDEKFENTEIHSTIVDGISQINEIRFGGSKIRIAFD
jgi:hypothetical protein